MQSPQTLTGALRQGVNWSTGALAVMAYRAGAGAVGRQNGSVAYKGYINGSLASDPTTAGFVS